jgi:hypothetical protein
MSLMIHRFPLADLAGQGLIRQLEPELEEFVHQGLSPQVRVLEQPGRDIGLEGIERVRAGMSAFTNDPGAIHVRADGLAVPTGALGDLADRHSLSYRSVNIRVFLPCQHEEASLSEPMVRGQRPSASRRARPLGD